MKEKEAADEPSDSKLPVSKGEGKVRIADFYVALKEFGITSNLRNKKG